MKKKKIMATAVVDIIIWVQESENGECELIDIEDVLEISEFEEKFIYDEINY